jgi:subtilisin family serine protease
VALVLSGSGTSQAERYYQPPRPDVLKRVQHQAPVVPRPANDKLGTKDAELLAKAKEKAEKRVTLMVAAEPGKTAQVADVLDGIKGAMVRRVEERFGYVSVTVPTAQADGAIARAAKLSAVRAIDLNEKIKIPDPRPHGAKGAKGGGGGDQPAPGRGTPAANPYQPAAETGAVDFVKRNPQADGRGITIGILDTGIDLAQPALRTTTTGEREIVDWVTATDPVDDYDGTWLQMDSEVTGPEFIHDGRRYTAPAGEYLITFFHESVTTADGQNGDLNRDGDTTDSWAVLYDGKAGTVRVDLGGNADFTDDQAMKPYGQDHQYAFFGTDDPKTAIAEAVPFTVEIRRDVELYTGEKRDFVNIGIVSNLHGTHVAGIAAANGLFGGEMDGAAPGARLRSGR